ncbi:hypothetical protein ACFX2I_021068 [Malus domestica]
MYCLLCCVFWHWWRFSTVSGAECGVERESCGFDMDGVHGTKALALAISYSRGREVKTRKQYDKHVESVGDEVGREVEAVEE